MHVIVVLSYAKIKYGFRTTTSDKNYGKSYFGQFRVPTSLNNVEKTLAKLASSYVTGLQHYIGEEGDF